MAYWNDKQTQGSEQDEKKRPEEELVREQNSFGLPNSLMMAMPMTPPPGMPNSVMREMMGNADAEIFPDAVRLSGNPKKPGCRMQKTSVVESNIAKKTERRRKTPF